MRRRWVVSAALVLAVLVGAVVAAALFIDEPLRRYIQTRMNQRLDSYTVRIGKLDFHPLGFSIDFEDVQLTQDAHPDPPVAHIARITTSVHWKALLRGRVVGDFEVDRPAFHINLAYVRREAADERPVTKRGWQDALAAMYPLKINEVTVRQGELTYLDEGSFKPLRVSRLNAIATKTALRLLTAKRRDVDTPRPHAPSSTRVLVPGGVGTGADRSPAGERVQSPTGGQPGRILRPLQSAGVPIRRHEPATLPAAPRYVRRRAGRKRRRTG